MNVSTYGWCFIFPPSCACRIVGCLFPSHADWRWLESIMCALTPCLTLTLSHNCVLMLQVYLAFLESQWKFFWILAWQVFFLCQMQCCWSTKLTKICSHCTTALMLLPSSFLSSGHIPQIENNLFLFANFHRVDNFRFIFTENLDGLSK